MNHLSAFVCLLVIVLSACSGDPIVTITVDDLPAKSDPSRGEELFQQPIGRAPACNACHIEEDSASPDLSGYGTVAATRVEDISAQQYTFESIVLPARFIVEGYGNAMYNRYIDELTEQDIADLIAYLLTL